MKIYATLVLVAAASTACEKSNGPSTTQTTGATTLAPDDTRTNARDKADTVTPLDQGNNAIDLGTTQTIRKAVIADDSLSSDAKNVKIVTSNGVITLRGPVKTAAEKSNIGSKAVAAQGNDRVDNQIDIEAR